MLNNKILIIIILLCLMSSVNFAQTNANKKINVCVSANEMELYRLINNYRKQYHLKGIPLSASLCYVAQTHAKDVCINKPDVEPCNLHSWSNKGNWLPVCYTDDHQQANGMWMKPKELTNYTGNGYEIAFTVMKSDDENYITTAAEALEGWKKSSGHNAVIINQSIWSDNTWNAIGIGIYKGFAMVWFGTEKDEETIPNVCN